MAMNKNWLVRFVRTSFVLLAGYGVLFLSLVRVPPFDSSSSTIVSPQTIPKRLFVSHNTQQQQQHRHQRYAYNNRLVPKMHTCSIQGVNHTFPEAPTIILIGAQRAGTTAVLRLLRKHPQVVAPMGTDETHLVNIKAPTLAKLEILMNTTKLSREDQLCDLRRQYAAFYNHTKLLTPDKYNRSMVAFDKTPVYLAKGLELARMLKAVLPWKVKILVILRDPVERAWSQYIKDLKLFTPKVWEKFLYNETVIFDHLKLPPPTKASFEEFLKAELHVFNLVNLTQCKVKKFGTDAFLKTDFAKRVPPIRGRSKEEDDELSRRHTDAFRYNSDVHGTFDFSMIQRGMYAIQLDWWIRVFGKDVTVIRYEDLYSDARKGQQTFDSLLQFAGLQPGLLKLPSDFRQSHSKGQPMQAYTRAFLEAFFRPYNALLVDILGGGWKGVWEHH